MDCNMPFLDGYEATKQIRRLWKNIGIKREFQPRIVAVTGHVEEEYVLKAMSCGMDRVYPKPFPIKDFGKLLKDMQFIKEVPEALRLDTVSD
jgi:CheY-like chemotaxis protein